MNKSGETKNWYTEMANTYKSGYLALNKTEARKNWYSQVAHTYNKVRPHYPQELISHGIAIAKLPPDGIILEIGSGPGTATTAFAKIGLAMVCLEPNPIAYQLAKQNCAIYPKVEIKNTTFEEWHLETEKFDAVLAATSFHWVAPETGYAKAAAALKDKGYLILLWNLTPQPNYEIYQLLAEVYQNYAPSLARYEDKKTQETSLIKTGQTIIDSGYFKDLISEQITCKIIYSIDDYLALLSTFSPYIALEEKQRQSLFAALKENLKKNCQQTIELTYISAFQIAQKLQL